MTLNPQPGVQHLQNLGLSSNRLAPRFGMLCLMSVALLSGCVSTGEYEAEKAKALNFQRLLAQEEQRTDKLDARLQEVQQEVSSLGSQNRELAAERDSLQDQVARQQTSVQSGNVPDPASDMDISPDMSFSDPSLSEFDLSDFSFDESKFNDLGMEKADATGMGTPTYHTVGKKEDGSPETLWYLSKRYGVSVEQLTEWNNLPNPNLIQPGQRLIVSQP